MTVKINGVSFDTKRVMRFAPISGNLEMPERSEENGES